MKTKHIVILLVVIAMIAIMSVGCVSNPLRDEETNDEYEKAIQGIVVAEDKFTCELKEVKNWDDAFTLDIGYIIVTDERYIYFSNNVGELTKNYEANVLIKNMSHGHSLTIGTTYEWVIRKYSTSPYWTLFDVYPRNL